MKEIFKKRWFWWSIIIILLLTLPLIPCEVLTYGPDGNPIGTTTIAYKNLITILTIGCPV